MQVTIGADAQTEPYALVTPQTSLKPGSVLTPLAKAGNSSNRKLPAKLASVTGNRIVSQELNLLQFTLVQVVPYWQMRVHLA